MTRLDHSLLRQALAANLGKTLTPEVAAAIEIGSFDREDRSHSPAKFGQREYKGYTFQCERMGDILDDLHLLHKSHFEETEIHRLGFGLDPNYEYMQDMERQGKMIQFTARHEGKLVGNIRMYVQQSLHTGTLYASEDTFYMLPEHRKGFTALRFWQFMEESVRAIGVREIRTDSKVINKVHKLNEYCGYKHVANKYVKVFTE
jgi:hypothetical protein